MKDLTKDSADLIHPEFCWSAYDSNGRRIFFGEDSDDDEGSVASSIEEAKTFVERALGYSRKVALTTNVERLLAKYVTPIRLAEALLEDRLTSYEQQLADKVVTLIILQAAALRLGFTQRD